MPGTYTGNPATPAARTNPTITNPADGDQATAASNNAAPNTLADYIAFLQQNVALLGGTSNALPLRLEGAAGDTNPVVDTQTVPTTRKLLWKGASHATVKTRLYLELSDAPGGAPLSYHPANGGLLVTINAAWSGTAWAIDKTDSTAALYRFGAWGVNACVLQVPGGGFPATVSDADFQSCGLLLSGVAADYPIGTVLGTRHTAAGIAWAVTPDGTYGHIHEALHYVGALGEPAFGSGWANVSGHRKLAFWRDAFGMVHIEGDATGTDNTTVFTLPAGYRPTAPVFSPIMDVAIVSGYVSVAANGVVTAYSDGSGGLTARFHVQFQLDIDVAP